MKVIKRNGTIEEVRFDKILNKNRILTAKKSVMQEFPDWKIISKLTPLNEVDPSFVTQQVIKGIHDLITTQELDNYAASISQSLCLVNPEYTVLAGRIMASNLQKNVECLLSKKFNKPSEEIIKNKFYWVVKALWENKNEQGNHSPLIAPYLMAVVEQNKDFLESVIDYSQDFNIDYMGYSVLENSYLLKVEDMDKSKRVVVEQPQHLFMRVAIGIECAEPDPVGEIRDKVENKILELMKEMDTSLLGNSQVSIKNYGIKNAMGSFLESSIVNTTRFNAEQILNDLMQKDMRLTEKQKTAILNTYSMMSQCLATHATPTLFNAGTLTPQCSSCYLLNPTEDSMEGICETWRKEACISKWAGGIGSCIYSLRPQGSYIAGTNGTSNGIVPNARVQNNIAVYVDQGGNRRPGSNAVYCTPYHGDIEAFLQLRKERGVESERARDLFYGLWIPDEFMRSVINNKPWYLLCPNKCPGLSDVYDRKFQTEYLSDEQLEKQKEDFAFTYLYRSYVKRNMQSKTVQASDIWKLITDLQIETGLPYMLYSDACCRKSNQNRSGLPHSSNLCTEIIENTNIDEDAVCNLASICVNNFYNTEKKEFNWEKLREIVHTIVYNLNKIIDINYYPTMNTRRSNLRHRPMGIGVQGLADLFVLARVPFDSNEARLLNFQLFERIYYYALEKSNLLAEESEPYPSFHESPSAEGILQFDLWLQENARNESSSENVLYSNLSMPWDELKQKIQKTGLKNSLFVAPMPTASTAGIMGNSPCFEPFNSLIYKKRIKSGEFIIINKYLVKDLIKLGLWDSNMRDNILLNDGSIQKIYEIPAEIRNLYKTVWDMSPKVIMNLALDRGVFVDQSQSMNLFISDPHLKILSQVHMYGWKRGAKTGSYYIWGRAPIDAQKIQVSKDVDKMIKKVSNTSPKPVEQSGAVCMRGADCTSCGS